MKTRILSGIVIFVLLLLTLSSGGNLLAVCLCLVSLVAFRELAGAFGLRGEVREADGTVANRKTGTMEAVGYLGVVLHYVILVFTKGDPRFFIGTVIMFVFAETLIYVIRFPKYHMSVLTDIVFSFLYAPVMLSFLFLIREMQWGHLLVWMPFASWVCDTCAYFSGMAFGKHKLCPQLSPKKTVEGAIGGALGATVAAALYGLALPGNSGYYNSHVIWACMLIGLATGILSQLGDLLASGIKRDRGIKDFGTLIPGHGGIMDRFDSVIFVTPVVYCLIVFLLQPAGV